MEGRPFRRGAEPEVPGAHGLHLGKGRARVNIYHRTMRFDDLEAVARLGQGPKEKERLCQIANELAERPMRGGLSAYWWLPLEGIGYSSLGNHADCEAGDADLFNLSAFPYVKHHPA